MVLAMLLNSGLKLNEISVFSSTDNLHGHGEDFKIASNISSRFSFKLNNSKLDDKGKLFNMKDSLFCSLYSKLGFHKEFYFQKKFFNKPRFRFTGAGGGILKGYPGKSIEKYMKLFHQTAGKLKTIIKNFMMQTFVSLIQVLNY